MPVACSDKIVLTIATTASLDLSSVTQSDRALMPIFDYITKDLAFFEDNFCLRLAINDQSLSFVLSNAMKKLAEGNEAFFLTMG